MKKLSTTVFIFLLIGSLSSASAEVIELRYSTYLGTEFEEGDYGPAVAVDSIGAAYLTGSTDSFFAFPTVNAYQSSGSGTHNPLIFVTKFSSSGSTLQYSTYLRGSNYSAGLDLAVDSQGRAWVVGFTAATDFPVKNAYQGENAGGPDGFITRFSPDL
ncbi:MAG TPA: hypothetical protein ENH12_01285, partial [Proteobacteria bacterium]|nr:hypothetical protein [Pseudomonadota bacterium]